MWGWIILAAGVAGLAAAVFTGVRVAVRAWRLWLAFRAVQHSVLEALALLSDAAARTGEWAARLGEDERLAQSVDRLGQSRAQLAVLVSAVQEVRDLAGSVTAMYPRK
jgi:hypothetical protein